MTALVEDKVAAYVADHPGKTAYEIAMAIRARRQTVDGVLASPLFTSSDGPRGARVFSLSGLRGRARTATTHKARVLRLLQDGRPHSHMEGYRLGVMLHSRVADLRRDGYRIVCWRDGDEYLYQLRTLEEGAVEPQPSASSSSGRRADGLLSPTAQVQAPAAHQQGHQLALTGAAFRKQAA